MSEENQTKKSEWTPEAVEKLIKFIDTLAEKYLKYKENENQSKANRLKTVSQHNRRLTYSLIAFMAAIISLMTVLTFFERVSGDALLFVVGTITGYIIIFIQRLVESPIEEPSSIVE